jgi:CBS domain-containing protein
VSEEQGRVLLSAGERSQAAGLEGRGALNMYSPLSAVIRREPITVPLEATVREALGTMDRMRIGCIIVADPQRRVPLGVFTLQDLLRRVTLPRGDLQQPIACVMTSGLITLKLHATAHEAALAMARHGVRHVLVVDGDGRLAGIVSQNDLFSVQRVGVKEISTGIQAAMDVEGLRGAALGIRQLADGLMAQGINAETLTHYISTLNDLLTIRVIELTADELDLPAVPMCWIALGSEGRLEQTFDTDQDNGIIFDADEADADRVRGVLLLFAQAVNRKLDACGFPLCKGNVMASNPQWCLTLAEWRRRFSSWMFEPRPEALLHAAVFFDLRPVYGDEKLAEQLREWLLGVARDRPLFLRLMAENAMHCEPPLGTIRDFVYDNPEEFPHTIDLKTYGSRPFVDAARVFSLAHAVPHTSTAERLRGAAEALNFASSGLGAVIDGFYFVHLLRLGNRRRSHGAPVRANRVDPRELGELDRHVLKEAFRQARKLQSRLVSEYRL